MNKKTRELVKKIDVDEHLAHYQKMNCTQRIKILTGLFDFSLRARKRSQRMKKQSLKSA